MNNGVIMNADKKATVPAIPINTPTTAANIVFCSPYHHLLHYLS
ncbi:hypothetical protein [Anaerovibrio sp.]|nr:hypothetical protein [Anaerovibrio sp.]